MRLSLLRSALLAVAVAIALPVPAAHADTVAPTSAPPLRFVSYNMCGHVCRASDDPKDPANAAKNATRDDYIDQQADVSGWNADEVMLQEVCKNQFTDLQSRLQPKGFTGLFIGTRPITSDICFGSEYGMAIFVKGGVLDTKFILLKQGAESENIISPCMKHLVQYRAVWACSVHLYWSNETLRRQEAAVLAAQVKTWEDSGTPVVLGGDFNDEPQSPTMSYFYSGTKFSSATGGFLEADETDTDYFSAYGCDPAQVTDCRSGALTFYNTETLKTFKIDYLLFDETKFKDVKGDPQPLNLYLSDHQLYRGAASWADCPGANPNGVIRRDATGALFRYSGRTDSTLAPPCKVGTGWNIMSTVVRHGDFDGNGSEDLIAVDGSGVLWLYPADAAGTFSGSTRRSIGTGWQVYDKLLAPGDFNGDGKADLIGQDGLGDLYFYAGDGTGHYAPRTKIGWGWDIYNTVLAPGDFNGDGKADLIGRDSSGVLWFYAGTGSVVAGVSNGYKPKISIGTGWQIYNGLTAAGDVNGDGKGDLIGRDSTGVLWFYAGTGSVIPGVSNGYAARTKIADITFPAAGELLF